MGTGARYERAAYGQALGESKAIQEHTLAMIPIVEQQAESELRIQEAARKAEVKYIETLSDVMGKMPGAKPQGVTYVQPPAAAPAESAPSKSMILLIAAGIAIWFYFKR